MTPIRRGTAARLGLFRPGVLRHAGIEDRRAVRVQFVARPGEDPMHWFADALRECGWAR